MSKYNMSRGEAKRAGVARVKIGGRGGGSSKKKSGGFKLDTGAFDSLVGKLSESYKPTADENATNLQLDNLLASRNMGVSKIKAEPMASVLVRGQSQVLRNQAQDQATPLSQKLARIQARRAGATDALKASLMGERAKLGYKTQEFSINDGVRARNFQQDFQNKSFGEQVRQFNQNFGLKQRQENRIASNSGNNGLNDAAIVGFLNNGQQPQGFTSKNPALNTNKNFPTKFNYGNLF